MPSQVPRLARPHVIVNCAISLDGYLDDSSPNRLLLSNEEDFERVDELRASVDAIMVGANTIRKDDPRLLIRSEALRSARLTRGAKADPIKVTITRSGNLSPSSRFFTMGEGEKLVYCVGCTMQHGAATIIETAHTLPEVLADLKSRGIEKVMVEGGSRLLGEMLASSLVDEVSVAIAPLLLGERGGVKLVDRTFSGGRRMKLQRVDQIGEMALLHYTFED